MTSEKVISLLTDALMTGLKISAPLLLASVIVGLIISIFQAATQVNEQTMTFVPKIIAIALVLIILGPWMMSTMMDYFNRTMAVILEVLK